MRAVPRLSKLYLTICLTIEEKARKNLIVYLRKIAVASEMSSAYSVAYTGCVSKLMVKGILLTSGMLKVQRLLDR